jgi:toxin ParE1/3/4
MNVVFRPEAERDLIEARDWYDNKRNGLGTEFLAEAGRTIEKVGESPGWYETRWRNVRSCQLNRFPYLVFFRVLDDRIEIVGVLHGRRDDSVWRKRLR